MDWGRGGSKIAALAPGELRVAAAHTRHLPSDPGAAQLMSGLCSFLSLRRASTVINTGCALAPDALAARSANGYDPPPIRWEGG